MTSIQVIAVGGGSHAHQTALAHAGLLSGFVASCSCTVAEFEHPWLLQVGIEYSAGFTAALAGLAETPVPWSVCLQGNTL